MRYDKYELFEKGKLMMWCCKFSPRMGNMMFICCLTIILIGSYQPAHAASSVADWSKVKKLYGTISLTVHGAGNLSGEEVLIDASIVNTSVILEAPATVEQLREEGVTSYIFTNKLVPTVPLTVNYKETEGEKCDDYTETRTGSVSFLDALQSSRDTDSYGYSLGITFQDDASGNPVVTGPYGLDVLYFFVTDLTEIECKYDHGNLVSMIKIKSKSFAQIDQSNLLEPKNNLPPSGFSLVGTEQSVDDDGYIITLSWNLSAEPPASDEKISCASTVSGSSVIACENQSLGEDIDIAGTPFQLHYQSDRVPGRSDANSFAVSQAREFGGWFLDIHHVYDTSANVLYLGYGEHLEATLLGSVKTKKDGFMIASADANEVYEFDSKGRHLRTAHALTGVSIYEFTYDDQQRLLRVKDMDGNVTTIERKTGDGAPSAIIGPFGQRTELTVDSNGYLASVTDPAKQIIKISSTDDGLLTSFTNKLNRVSTYQYDTHGRLLRADNTEGGFQKLSRIDSADGERTITRSTAEGRSTTYQVIRSTDGEQSRIITNEAGLQVTSGRTAGNVESVEFPNGVVTSRKTASDPRFGRSAPVIEDLTIATPLGLVQRISETREVELSDAADPYDLNTLIRKIDINGRTYESNYRASDKTITSTTPSGRENTRKLDGSGRVIQKKISGLFPENFTYDSRGRLIKITQGEENQKRTVQFSYDNAGFLNSIIDPMGHKVSFVNDAVGRITQKTLPDNGIIGYSYDANSNITSVTPPGKPAHFFKYNKLDFLASYSAPSAGGGSGQTKYTYNLDRQWTQSINPDGSTISAGYDKGGRLGELSSSRGVIKYDYDPETGNLSSIDAPGNINLSYNYDGDLPIEDIYSGPISGSIQRDYDNDFRIKEIRVNGTHAVDISYDEDSLPIRVGDLSLTHNSKNGLLESTGLGQIQDNWTYNGFGEPIAYKAAYGNLPLLSISYVRDLLGRITQKTEIINGVKTVFSYSYDLVGRLIEVRKNGSVLSSYTYDSNGNRLTYTGSIAGTVTGTYDAQDRMKQYGGAIYTYTANGELSSKTVGNKTTTYQYDILGNLIRTTLPDGTSIEYLIDGRNRRIGKKVNGSKVRGFLYENQLRPAAELDSNNRVVSRFVYASHINVPDYLIKSGVTYRIVTDHLGSPRLVVNTSTGKIIQEMDYDEFGNVTKDTNPGFQPFGFAGGVYDRDTKLVRFGARDYDAETGRWTAKDPIGFRGKTVNLYEYTANDPINNYDPMGNDWRRTWQLIVLIHQITSGLYKPFDPKLHGPPVSAIPADPHQKEKKEREKKRGSKQQNNECGAGPNPDPVPESPIFEDPKPEELTGIDPDAAAKAVVATGEVGIGLLLLRLFMVGGMLAGF